MIYNFTLAPLILWSVVKGDARVLTEWARGIQWVGERATYLNITATHDGIGMRPTEGILNETQRAELVQLARERGGDVTGKRNADGSISPYELNINYFDALSDPRADEPDDLRIRRFLVSQAIPMALMGIPGLYIHSLLGSRNDYEEVARSGRARSINRAQLRLAELEAELHTPGTWRGRIFQALRKLLALRARQSAFHPDAEQEVMDVGPGIFAVRRRNRETGQEILALHNVTEALTGIRLDIQGTDLITGAEWGAGGTFQLEPYQFCWVEVPPDSTINGQRQ